MQGVEFSDLLAEWQELKSVLRVCTSMTTLHDVLMYVELNEEGDTEYPQMRTLLRLLFTLPVGTSTAERLFHHPPRFVFEYLVTRVSHLLCLTKDREARQLRRRPPTRRAKRAGLDLYCVKH